MVNILSLYISMLDKIMKLVGMQPREIEIEPGTTMHFWVPTKVNNKIPNVVLLHGFAGDGILTWQFQVLSLRKNYNIYVPDFLFFGKSSTNRIERSARFQADCIVNGLKMLGLEGMCTVVGFSYGGYVGFQMAEHYPELVGSMVVSGSDLAWTESLNRKALKRIGFSSLAELLLPVSAQGVKALLEVGSYHFPPIPHLLHKNYLEIMCGYRKERAELLDALVVADEHVTTHQFHQRIHLLWGSENKMEDVKDANRLKERLGGKTELHVIKEAGHLVQLERPFVYNKHLKQILHALTNESC